MMPDLNLFGQPELWVAVGRWLLWVAIPAGTLAAVACFIVSSEISSRSRSRQAIRKLRRGHYPW